MVDPQLLVPVAGVPGPAQAVHRDTGHLERRSPPGRDPVDGAQDLSDTVGGPGPGLGDDQGAVGGEQPVDGEEPERGRAVDDHDLVAHPFHRDGQPVVGADRVGEQLGLAGSKRCGRRHHRWRPSALGGPSRGHPQPRDRPRAFLGQGLVDAERWVPHAEPRGRIALRVEIDHEGVDAPRPRGRGKAQGHRGLADAALLIDHRDHCHDDNVANGAPLRQAEPATDVTGRVRGCSTRVVSRRVLTGLILAMALPALDLMALGAAGPQVAGELGRLDQVAWLFVSCR